MIKTVVVDDEPLARRRILRLLKAEPDVDVVAECSDGREAIATIRQHQPDLVFLDVQMPEIDGFGVLQALDPQQVPLVIFTTAYDQYAVRAFEVHALDYLVKPFDPERFRSAFQRARDQLERAQASDQNQRLITLLEQLAAQARAGDGAAGGDRYLDRLMIRSGGKIFFVKTAEIDWVEAAANYVRLHVGRESHVIRETISNLAERLDPTHFARIHRSTIVNLDRVKEMQPWFSGEYIVILRDGTRLKLSRGYRERLEEQLGQTR
ncbi:MAG TPA: LytTR family DNA-binding domain-containing protein [Gemmatimonadaceae bacterium]|nr:LytTR family DNA-binding domain-containing protein [Gemmatimonadaceae bacterium]